MPDPGKLPFLLRLLDDDTPQVREAVRHELAGFGPSLRTAIAGLGIDVPPASERLIDTFLNDYRRQRLRHSWPGWVEYGDDKDRLEAALGMIAEFLDEQSTREKLAGQLDDLAGEFTGKPLSVDARGLATFLFRMKRLRGAREDYYHVQNSNLVSVIERQRGIPISLSCIYVLVGHRLGIALDGCNFPGHFLALATNGDRHEVIDCYNGGIVLADSDFLALDAPPGFGIDDVARLVCDSSGIVARVFRNLLNAYRLSHARTNESEPPDTETRLNIQLVKELLETVDTSAS